jgi:hypothetical protein
MMKGYHVIAMDLTLGSFLEECNALLVLEISYNDLSYGTSKAWR